MKSRALFLAVLALLATGSLTRGVSVGLTDTFEDGTTQNWVINLLGLGSPPAAALPVNVASGGPAGVNDNYLRLTAVGGGGAGSRLSAINFMSQWAGDYIAAGIDTIRMDVVNLGTTDLSLRLLFSDPVAGPPSNVALSQVPLVVPAGSGWVPLVFPVNVAALTALSGDVETALRNTTELRLFHGTDPNFPGPALVAQVGVDNIQAGGRAAGTVPDAGGTLSLLAAGMLMTGLARRWR